MHFTLSPGFRAKTDKFPDALDRLGDLLKIGQNPKRQSIATPFPSSPKIIFRMKFD